MAVKSRPAFEPISGPPAREPVSDLAAAFQPPPDLHAADFERIRRMAYQHFGLELRDGKETLVVARLGKMLRRNGFTSFRAYVDHVAADRTGEALIEMVDALTTNFTSFLREPAHFEFLKNTLAPQFAHREVDIWSAACSTGEEPWSVLFTLLDTLGDTARVRILATDISTKALRAAESAVYEKSRLEGLPEHWARKYFLAGHDKWKGWHRVRPEYRSRVRFMRFNLIADELPSPRFALILCRNVMIYFDKTTQGGVVRRLSTVLQPGGHLFIGHSETLSGTEHGLAYVRPAIYKMPEKGGAWTRDPS